MGAIYKTETNTWAGNQPWVYAWIRKASEK
jgi:hypothetical protein